MHRLLPARRSPRSRVALFVALVAALTASAPAASPLEVRLSNGIRAVVHSPEDILADLTRREGDRLWMVLDTGLRYELVTDVADPVIANKGDGQFHPMPVGTVVAALEAVELNGLGLDLDVYVLPYPRREVLDSSARDGMILLSPGVRPMSEYAVHFTVIHEIGHTYQYRWLPDSDREGWDRYNALRDIADASVYHANGEHRNRPHEIFAEDFRYLFGGDIANYSGGIENDMLPLPLEIAGLETFLQDLSRTPHTALRLARIDSSPNPFNPETEIRVRFDSAPSIDHARVRVVDAQGREVRHLYDGVPTSPLLRLHWDGRTSAGSRVSSGLYFARLDYQGGSVSTKLLLVK